MNIGINNNLMSLVTHKQIILIIEIKIDLFQTLDLCSLFFSYGPATCNCLDLETLYGHFIIFIEEELGFSFTEYLARQFLGRMDAFSIMIC